MKKIILSLFFLMAVGTIANAQQISVVASEGITTLYTSLDSAIIRAAAGSTIYLSGGAFQVKDETRIRKKLAIIGIGHRPDNDNADGSTMIGGNLFFEGGANSSALMGVYLSGHVYIGTGENAVNNFLLRYCNVNSIQVQNSNCRGIVINQNYIRSGSNGGNSTINFTNNILHSVNSINGGAINHNVITNGGGVSNSQVKDNIFLNGHISSFSTSHNMATSSVGDDCVVITDWADVLEGPNNGVSPTSNYQLKGSQGKNAATDGTDIGIYGGITGFKDSALPPVSRIVSKQIAEQTDDDGKLKIQVQIKTQ